ncbi:leucine-rich repeat protein [Acetobacterium malicum]|nr:leucine-rich repeat protein [Acetobacterium dehalogenans]
MQHKRFYWWALMTLVFLGFPATALAADNPPGVAYRGHIQDFGDYPTDGSWVDSPAIIGTVGQSKRIEGFEIKLTGTVPEGMELRYNVHVQNKGWLYDENDSADWPKDGAYAGTRGNSLRIEAVKIVLTDSEGKPVGGYAVQYRGHVQNVGDLPADDSQWLTDGEQLGTVGSSLRLEALLVQVVKTGQKDADLSDYTALLAQLDQLSEADYTAPSWAALQSAITAHPVTVKNSQTEVDAAVAAIQVAYDKLEKKNVPVEPVVYDQVGTYGPKQGSETIVGDVMVAADGVILQNLVIAGSLTISEAVGSGTVTLNNVTVEGDTLVRGGGVHSIKINGGQYRRIIMEKTASGAVRIVATGVDGLEVVVAEDASGEAIILEGTFESVTVNAPNMRVTTQGNTTTIGTMTVGVGAGGSTVTVAAGTTISDLVLDGKAAVKGQGTVAKAAVKADGVVFDKKPGTYTVAAGVVIPPVFPTPDSGGGSGGGYTPPGPVVVIGVSLNKTTATLSLNATESLTATVAPAAATNKTVSWSSSNDAIATVDSSGTVTAVSEGQATITVTSQDGHKSATCTVTVKDLQPAIAGVTVPFAGATPVTAITTTSQFSGTVSWQKNDGSGYKTLADGEKFDGTSTYLATITLTIKAPYTEMDIPRNFFAVAGATASNDAGSAVVTAEFLPTHRFKITELGVITAYSGPGGILAVPATINNSVVTGIGENTFSGQQTITEITLPATVTAIGKRAFDGCTSLTAVTFTAPASLKTIDEAAFTGCELLKSITIPNQVTTIGPSAFSGCEKLATVTFAAPAALTSIGASAFFECDALGEMTIPAKVTSLGVMAFSNCRALDTVTINGNLLAIEDWTFFGCRSLSNINIPDSVQSIGDAAFSGCSEISTMTIPATVTSLGGHAFYGCLNLTTVTFTGPAALSSIGNSAFYNCQKLTAVEIPAQVTTIAATAFGYDEGSKPASRCYTFRGPAPTTLGPGALPTMAPTPTIRYYGNYDGYTAVAWDGYANKSLILATPTQTALQIANSGTPSVTVNWSTVAGADAYDVFVREATGTYGTATASVASGVTTTVITGLDSSKSYYFVVKARDAYGQSLPSDEQFTDFSIAVTGVSLDPATLNLVYGATATLSATVAPANATNPGITWASSNPTVATVDQSGTVTAAYAGTAVITASSMADGSKKATTTVTVQGRLKINSFKAVAGSADGNFVSMILEGDTFKTGVSSFDFNAGTTGLALGSPTSSMNNYSFLLANTAAPGTLTLQATGLTSGVNSTTVSLTVTAVTLDKETADLTVGGNLNLMATVLPAEAPDKAVSWSSDTPGVATVDENGKVTGVAPGTAIIMAQTAVGVQDTCTVTVKPVFETTATATAVTITKYNGSETNVVIPATINSIPVTEIGANAFSGNTRVTSVTIPATVTTLGEQAFAGCSKLSMVNLPAAITSIPSQAFENCPLIDITIGAGVTFADAAAMGQSGTSFITAYNTNGAGNYHCYFNVVYPLVVWTYGQVVENGMSFNTSTQTINAYNGSGVAVTIPARISGTAVTTLYKKSFTSKKLTGLTFAADSQLVAIGDGAFFSNNLGNLSLPVTVKTIGGSAFESCQLNSVTLSPVLESIGLAAFSGNKLTEITIPDSVTTIDLQAFVGNQLTKVVIAGSGEAHLTLGNGVFQRTGVGQNEIVDITLPDNVVIPNDVTMGAYGATFKAFYEDPTDNNKVGGRFVYDTSAGTWSKP